MNLQIPYGQTYLEVDIPECNLYGVVHPHIPEPLANFSEELASALHQPIGCRSLVEEIRGKKKVCIVITDITRPNCYQSMLPVLINTLEKGGIQKKNITILVATGLHRPNTKDELTQMLGEQIVSEISIINHRADKKEDLVYLDKTSQGCPVWVNRKLLESDYVICTGVIEPHFWAGFSGGRKAIGIGCSGDETIRFLHSPKLFQHSSVRMGNIEGNVFHLILDEIADKAGAHFLLNFIMNENKQVCAFVCGERQAAFEAGVKLAEKVYQVELKSQADIVIAGVGYPKSSNLYQGTRGASCAALSPFPAVRKGGMVITPLPAEEGAGRGVGEERFRNLFSKIESAEHFVESCLKNGYPAGAQRAFLLALTMCHCQVVVTNLNAPAAAQELHLTVIPTLQAAVEYGLQIYGEDSKILVVPDGARFFSVRGVG